MDKKPLRILSASAGSGKTFNLAETYIRLALTSHDPLAYRGILAVTFTNASTDDMKRKILQELQKLANNPDESSYKGILVPRHFNTSGHLSARASKVLNDILHDYSSFAISTIDHFFQTVIHAFSREIGKFASYQVELDKDSLIKESIDRVMDDIGDKDIRLLQKNIVEAAKIGKGYNLDKTLKEMAGSLLSEEHRSHVERMELDDDKVYDSGNITKVEGLLKKYREDFVDSVRKAAKEVSDAFDSCGIDFKSTLRQQMDCIRNLQSASMREIAPTNDNDKKSWKVRRPTDALLMKAKDFEGWWKKSDYEKYKGYEDALMPPFTRFAALFVDLDAIDSASDNIGGKPSDAYRCYVTAGMILDSMGELALASRLRKEFMDLMQEKNVLCIDDSNTFLRRIIDGSDAPFVYEKTGVRFKHYLMDEFQDTSRVQWENFRPLIANSLAGDPEENPEDLLVGDVKQSIYRWRGADWKLMQEDVPSEFKKQLAPCKPLEGNYRSLANIVEFNNDFFHHCTHQMDGDAVCGLEALYGYKSAATGGGEESGRQKAMQKDDPAAGYVEAIFCAQDHEAGEVVAAIRRAIDNHARYGDIAVLTRRRSDSTNVASCLTENGIPVISNDSLSLKNAMTIKIIISMLNHMTNPKDKVKSWFARDYIGVDMRATGQSFPDLCDDILTLIKERDTDAFRSETQYILAFMDTVRSWAARNGNDLPAFLEWWDENDPTLSSPSGTDAVTVTTIHKSKGLEFPCVIVPYLETIDSSKKVGRKWCCANVDGTFLEGIGKFPVYVNMSKRCDETLFKGDYTEESRLTLIDDLNVMYVALTRAKKNLTLISADPMFENDGKGDGKGKSSKCNELMGMLRDFMEKSKDDNRCVKMSEDAEGTHVVYSIGEPYDYAQMPKKEVKPLRDAFSKDDKTDYYPIFPLNPLKRDKNGNIETDKDGKPKVRHRLRLRSDTADFFRHRGIVQHAILARVTRPSDLPGAVEDAVLSGELKEQEKAITKDTLRNAIDAHPEWFPADGEGVLNETTVIGTELSPMGDIERRPDRVVLGDGKVTIIDYKFGKESPKHHEQVRDYMSVYKKLYPSAKVYGFLWYLPSGDVVSVV